VQQWMKERGITDRVTDEVFIAMSKALSFIEPDQLSIQCVLIVLNRFLQEIDRSKIAFLEGSPTGRLCEPLKRYIEQRGGIVRTDAPVKRILANKDLEHSISGLVLRGNEIVAGNYYLSAMPIDTIKKLLPDEWRSIPHFRNMTGLNDVPRINVHVWFDRKLSTVDNLIFSRSKLLSVYADMPEICREYSSDTCSMLEMVFAPAKGWICRSDEKIFISRHMKKLALFFPNEIKAGVWESDDGNFARVPKYSVVKTPTSVDETPPGCVKIRPSQKCPISNFFMAGVFTKQKYLASMEGAVLSGQLAAKELF